MQKPFTTQPELFVTSADLEHASLRGLDGAETVLDWDKLENLMAGIYAGKTGRPRIRTHNQNMTVAARAIAERKTVGDLS